MSMNRLSVQKRAQIVQLLVEGVSMRAASRITGCSINTVIKLLCDVGEACLDYQDRMFVDLPCTRVQVDELCSYVGCRRKNEGKTIKDHPGEVWVWTAICADTKLIPVVTVGDRSLVMAKIFMKDLAVRLKNRVQLTSDGFSAYEMATDEAFGIDVDFGMLIKQYDHEGSARQRYKGALRHPKIGNPDPRHISTSYIERSNLTLRMGCKRFTRQTNAFSKLLRNHILALALHHMHYNFGRIHSSLRVSPAMAAGISPVLWSFEDIVRMSDGYWMSAK